MRNMLFDTHCHPNLLKQKKSLKTINDFLNLNKNNFLNLVGINYKTNLEVLKLSNSFENIFCSLGIHPLEINGLDLEEEIKKIIKLIEKNTKIKAIGECGLDYYRLKKSNNLNLKKQKELQKVFFEKQILLAKKFKLPIIIHNRESSQDIFKILQKYNFKNFIFHCYSENLDFAKKLLNFAPNSYISFSGIITFKNAIEIQETAKHIPLKNILIETDTPYLTPVPLRGKEENEPKFVSFILDKIIELRNEGEFVIKKQILENSLKAFNINKV